MIWKGPTKVCAVGDPSRFIWAIAVGLLTVSPACSDKRGVFTGDATGGISTTLIPDATMTGTTGAPDTGTTGPSDEPNYPGPGEGTDDIGGLAPLSSVGRAPRSIGTGLPYDTRPMIGAAGTEGADVWTFAADYETTWTDARSVTAQTATSARYLGMRKRAFFLLQPGIRHATVTFPEGKKMSLSLEDDGVYMLDPDSNFRTEVSVNLYDPSREAALFADFDAHHPLVAEGLRPLTIELFTADVEGSDEQRLGHAVTWVLDGNPAAWHVVGPVPQAVLVSRVQQEAAAGFRPLSISSRTVDGVVSYAAIFIADALDPTETEIRLGIGPSDLAALAEQVGVGDTRIPFSIASRDGGAVFDVVASAKEERQEATMSVGLDDEAFRELDASWRKAGMHLVTATSYTDGAGVRRWSAVWQAYDRVDRWTRIPADDWGPWEVAHKTVVGLGSKLSGMRPAQVFVALEQDEVVAQGAYTMGPAIWPTTRMDMAFPLGSISKSLTAAVVVQAMTDAGIDLFEPLVNVVRWNPAYFTDGSNGEDVDYRDLIQVRVVDLLRHSGGFAGKKVTGFGAYYNHLTQQANLDEMGASADVRRLPLSSQALDEWIYGVLTGAIHLPIDPKTGREKAIWNPYFATSGYEYSNPGYSILGIIADRLAPEGLVGTLRAWAAQAGADESLWPINDTRLPRRGDYHAIRHRRQLHLGSTKAPYAKGAEPAFADEDRFGFTGPQVSEWSRLAPPMAPATTISESHSARYSLRGQSLAAGGFEATAEDIARLFRALFAPPPVGILDEAVAARIRSYGDPNRLLWRECPWCDGYGLGVYLYRNWVIGAGTVSGAATIVAHNVVYDVTFTWLGSSLGSALGPADEVRDGFNNAFFAQLEATWPCKEDSSNWQWDCCDFLDTPYENECDW